ncbi:MAG: putative baseplate assembly protein [Nitrospira sp.]|nr:putative baseplate assembly protein [Nitrospira sp.]
MIGHHDRESSADPFTPLSVSNRSGLDKLRYRVGTHSSFLASMKAALSRRGSPILGRLTSDTGDDPAIALLDAWATVADVLTFYQERIANEGYLRTATEHRSLVELARLVGYVPRPGVAASVHLAYTVESAAPALPDQGRTPSAMKEPSVTIPAGARVQSIPGPGELPQTFETSEELDARASWNKLKPRLTRPQRITPDNVDMLKTVYFEGTATGLKPNDVVLFDFKNSARPFYRRIAVVHEPDFANKRTMVTLQPKPLQEEVEHTLESSIQSLTSEGTQKPTKAEKIKREILNELKQTITARVSPQERLADLSKKVATIEHRAKQSRVGETREWMLDLSATLNKTLTKDPGDGIKDEDSVQPVVLDRQSADGPVSELVYATLNASPLPKNGRPSDRLAQTRIEETDPVTVYAFRLKASLFGDNAPKEPTELNKKKVMVFNEWLVSTEDKTPNTLYLDASYDKITPNSWVILEYSRQGIVVPMKVNTVDTGISRALYGITGKTSKLVLSPTGGEAKSWFQDKEGFAIIRQTVVYAQSEELHLAGEPLIDPIGGEASTRIELNGYVEGLEPGRWLIVTGEEVDVTPPLETINLTSEQKEEAKGKVTIQGARRSELVQLSTVQDGWAMIPKAEEKTISPTSGQPTSPATPGTTDGKGMPLVPAPGNATHTTLVLKNGLQSRYKRETVEIFGNVVRATHGETRKEVLGSGDAGKALQHFPLSQPPLTYTAASTPAGIANSLSVYVNGVRWKEEARLTDLGSSDRAFVVQTDEEQKATIIFGDGQHGARLPTGVENVKAEYRSGIGTAGNVEAEQVRLLMTRPLGVKSVDNPLRASGGADPEGSDLVRANASLGVMAFDRVVSVQDYEDFARSFAGIGKARADLLRHGRQQFIHLTIAGIDDGPIDKDSDLHRHLTEALRRHGDPHHQFVIASRELLVLVLSAKVAVHPDYQWANVEQQVRTTVLAQFSFAKCALGQDAYLSEVISTIQNVRGVHSVDVDVFDHVPQIQEAGAQRRLLPILELDRLARKKIEDMKKTPQDQPKDAISISPARIVAGAVCPAQLGYIPFAVPSAIELTPRHI